MSNDKLILQKEEEGFVHQYAVMPSVPDPETVIKLHLYLRFNNLV